MKKTQYTKETSDKLLLTSEIVIAIFGLALFFVAIFAVAFMTMHPALGGTIIAAGVICLLVAWGLCLKIEHIAGYYECPRCEARYVPKFKDMCFSMNFGRARKMKCPHCGRKSWHEKVLTNNTEN